MLSFDDYMEQNGEMVRVAFEEMLDDQGYPSRVIGECDDGWEEFKQAEYDLYLSNQI